jgi:hypothetical protein
MTATHPIHGRRAFVALAVWRLTEQPLVEDAQRYFAMPDDTQFTVQYSEPRRGFRLWCQHPSFPAYATWAEVPEEVWAQEA